jgi:hypothetical protein
MVKDAKDDLLTPESQLILRLLEENVSVGLVLIKT